MGRHNNDPFGLGSTFGDFGAATDMQLFDTGRKKTRTHEADKKKRIKHLVKKQGGKHPCLDHDDMCSDPAADFAKYCGRKPKVAPVVVGPTDHHRIAGGPAAQGAAPAPRVVGGSEIDRIALLKYIETKVDPVLVPLYQAILENKPDDVLDFATKELQAMKLKKK